MKGGKVRRKVIHRMVPLLNVNIKKKKNTEVTDQSLPFQDGGAGTTQHNSITAEGQPWDRWVRREDRIVIVAGKEEEYSWVRVGFSES